MGERPNFFPDQGIKSARLLEHVGALVKCTPLRLPERGAKVLLMDEPVSTAARRGRHGVCEHAVPVHIIVGQLLDQDEHAHIFMGRCWECGVELGRVELVRDTLFGAKEDDAVLGSGRRARVYDGTRSGQ